MTENQWEINGNQWFLLLFYRLFRTSGDFSHEIWDSKGNVEERHGDAPGLAALGGSELEKLSFRLLFLFER